MGKIKLQSAMEYLMTYGWAILIIAVVLAALFQLGVFNPNSFAPKAHAGSCQVIRPYGSGNTNYISLAGTCNNQLPQYVAKFDGASSHITLSSGLIPSSGSFSMVVWLYVPQIGSNNAEAISQGSAGNAFYFGYIISGSALRAGDSWQSTGLAFPTGSYHMFAVVNDANANNGYIYIDGELKATKGSAITNPASSSAFTMGKQYGAYGEYWPGQMANLQIYNGSLSSNDITALYNEGIGGAPIDLFHLVAWWPLNGNANDYSGNLNNGVATNVIYTGSWASAYSAP